MKKHLLLIILAAGIYFPSAAQKKTKTCRFGSINNFGVNIGQDMQIAGSFQSVNGIKKDKWFAGLGLGLDYYLYRSVPLFIDVRREFGKEKHKFFAYADAGLNIDWMQEEYTLQPIGWDPNLSNKYHTGIYTDIGVGFLVGSKRGHGFVISLGHSIKTFTENRTYTDWRTGKPTSDTYKFNFSRAVVKIGWKF